MERSEISDAAHEFVRSLTALQLEVPKEIMDDVLRRWRRVSNAIVELERGEDPIAVLLHEHIGRDVTVHYGESSLLTRKLLAVKQGVASFVGDYHIRISTIKSVHFPLPPNGQDTP